MTITEIMVTTENNGIYKEKHYGLMETVERLEELVECDNVVGLEVMDTHTGEILYYFHLYPTGETYVSETLAVGIVQEVLG